MSDELQGPRTPEEREHTQERVREHVEALVAGLKCGFELSAGEQLFVAELALRMVEACSRLTNSLDALTRQTLLTLNGYIDCEVQLRARLARYEPAADATPPGDYGVNP